jgi:hypothetical protein
MGFPIAKTMILVKNDIMIYKTFNNIDKRDVFMVSEYSGKSPTAANDTVVFNFID